MFPNTPAISKGKFVNCNTKCSRLFKGDVLPTGNGRFKITVYTIHFSAINFIFTTNTSFAIDDHTSMNMFFYRKHMLVVSDFYRYFQVGCAQISSTN